MRVRNSLFIFSSVTHYRINSMVTREITPTPRNYIYSGNPYTVHSIPILTSNNFKSLKTPPRYSNMRPLITFRYKILDTGERTGISTPDFQVLPFVGPRLIVNAYCSESWCELEIVPKSPPSAVPRDTL